MHFGVHVLLRPSSYGTRAIINLFFLCDESVQHLPSLQFERLREDAHHVEPCFLEHDVCSIIPTLLDQLSGCESIAKSIIQILAFSDKLAYRLIDTGLIEYTLRALANLNSKAVTIDLLKLLDRILNIPSIKGRLKNTKEPMMQLLNKKVRDNSVLVQNLSKRLLESLDSTENKRLELPVREMVE